MQMSVEAVPSSSFTAQSMIFKAMIFIFFPAPSLRFTAAVSASLFSCFFRYYYFFFFARSDHADILFDSSQVREFLLRRAASQSNAFVTQEFGFHNR